MHGWLTIILEKSTRFLIANPWKMICVSLFPCVLAMFLLLGTHVNFSFMALMDTQEPLVKRYLELGEKVGMSKQLLLLLEGENTEELDAVQRLLEKELSTSMDVSYVIGTPPKKWMEDNIAWIADEETFQSLLIRAKNLHDKKANKQLASRQELLAQQYKQFSHNKARIMLVGLEEDPLDIDVYDVIAGEAPYDRLSVRTQEILKDFSIEGEYTGLGAIGAQDQQKTLRAIGGLTPVSLILVLLLLRLVEPRWKRLVSVAIPMILALGMSLGLTGFILGSITFSEGFFGLMIFGLGVDFGLHLLVRMREEREKNQDFEQALIHTITGCGPAIVAGAMTTAGAFAIIGFSPDPTAQHLGVSGGLGLFLCLLLMLTLLPAIWVIIEKKSPSPVIASFHVPLLGRVVKNSVEYPKTWFFCAFFCMFVAALGFPRYHFEVDLQKVFNRDVPAVKVSQRAQSLFQTNTTPWVVTSSSLQEARQVHRKFSEHEMFDRVFGIADVLPVDLSARQQQLQENISMLKQQEKVLKMLSVGPVQFSLPAQQMLRVVRSFQQSVEKGPIDLRDLPIALHQQLIGADGSFLTFAYGRNASYNAETLQQERIAAESIHSSAAGIGNFIEAAMLAERPWLKPIMASVLAFVILILSVDLRDFRWIMLAVIPVFFGVIMTFGILCWLETGFSILLLLVLPLLLGLGVDDGLHVVHRMMEDPDMPAHAATVSVSRAIVMTTLTTCSSFGVLLFSNHPGMESMASTLLLGLPICLISSATLIPAGCVLLGLRDSSISERKDKS